ncbi:energy transducer TonB [Flammeovirga pacifica]|uniref:TonB C-terminal domain-containing protein n=1 Tax=Flammeovirga pacifica TaxID=915059 RepID=A0A1S1YV49_FLAPC|nr:energy transducer TonB [Flammeovirga pacifica]OHX64891.1 hypothetical protein NH26_00295 [Flammeovirga pacifica]
MKLLIILLFLPTIVLSQNLKSSCEVKVDTLTNTSYYLNVDVQAKSIDSSSSIVKELSRKMKFSQEAKRKGLDGVKLFALFLITENGDVTGVRILRGGDYLDNKAEIISILEKKKYTPAICKNKKVASMQSFTLQLCY